MQRNRSYLFIGQCRGWGEGYGVTVGGSSSAINSNVISYLISADLPVINKDRADGIYILQYYEKSIMMNLISLFLNN